MKALIVFFLVISSVSAQNLDSLKAVWSDKGRNDTIRLEAVTALTRKYLFSEPSKALILAQDMLEFSKRTKHSKWQAGAYALIGVAHEVMGDFQKAAFNYMEWKNILEKSGERPKLAMAYNNIGNIYWKQGDLLTALDYYQKSLKIRLVLNDKSGIASVYNNIGLIFSNQKEHEKALDYYKKAEKILEEIKDMKSLISTYGNIGLSNMKLKRHDEAITYFGKSLEEAEKQNYRPGIASAYNSIGTILTEKGEYNKAVEYFEKAIEINTALGNYKSLASTHYNFGNLEIKRGNYENAKTLCKSGLDYAMKAKVLAEKMNNCECLYFAEKNSGNFIGSLSYYELYFAYRDSIASEDRRKEITRKEVRFEYEKKRSADSVLFRMQKITLQAEVEKQRAFAELEHLLSLKKSGQIDSLNKENYIRDLEIKNKENELLGAQKEKKLQDTEIRLQKTRLKQEAFQRYALFGGLFMVILFAVFMFNRFRVTRNQKNLIEVQKKEVEFQKTLIEEKNGEIMDSIAYAKHLQNAILPSIKSWMEVFPESFIFYLPKDIVAGDFYFLETIGSNVIFAAADCTGHGVPGAMVSVVCSNALNRTVNEFEITDPAKILDKVKELVINTFIKSEKDVNDGMDISLCVLNRDTNELRWAGANNPLWIVRQPATDNQQPITEFIELKPNKQPIGRSFESELFVTHKVKLQKGDNLYLFSDGFADQFGGEKKKKFGVARMKEFTASLAAHEMTVQGNLFQERFRSWKEEVEQIDDVCVIGIRV